MASFREARERLVAMDKECVAALDRSDITIREWQPPYGWYLALFVTVSVTFLAFSTRSNFAPNSLFAAFLPDFFRKFCYAIQPYLLVFLLVVHGAETFTMASGRLKRHNVNIRTLIYWQWVGDTFIEGVGAFNRWLFIVRISECWLTVSGSTSSCGKSKSQKRSRSIDHVRGPAWIRARMSKRSDCRSVFDPLSKARSWSKSRQQSMIAFEGYVGYFG